MAPTSTKKSSRVQSAKKSSRDKVRAYRERLRRQGLRPVQFWLPDVDSPGFIAEAQRTSLLIAQSPTEQEDQAFIDSLAVGDTD